MNLLKETLNDIKESGNTIEDIVFIGSEDSGHSCTWDEFVILADHEYDSGYGAQEVADDLIIVFKNGSKMWRHEYDGSEWWQYSKPFTRPENKLPIKHLFVWQIDGIGWKSLNELNSDSLE
jgi:hypothetical protein